MPRDLYDVLGVPGTASEAEIRHAFWALPKRYHPDANPASPDAARRFVEVGNAAETLLDPRRRAAYDESRTPAVPAGPPAAAPKPPPPPSTSPATRTTPPTAPAPVSQRPGNLLWIPVKAIAVVALIAVIPSMMAWETAHPPMQKQQGNDLTVNGAVVWKAAGFGLGDGWGINLACYGMPLQIVPGTSTDLEVADGFLTAGGHVALLPHGETLTSPSTSRCGSTFKPVL